MGCPTINSELFKNRRCPYSISNFCFVGKPILDFSCKNPFFELSTIFHIGWLEELGPRCKFDQNFPWALYCLGPLSQDLLGLFFWTYQTFGPFCQDLLGLVSGPNLTKAYLPLDTLYCKVSYWYTCPSCSLLFSKVQRLSLPLHFTFVTKRAVITKTEAAPKFSTKERKNKINCMIVEIPVPLTLFWLFWLGRQGEGW